MKRFYKIVRVVETPQGYAVHLDGKPVRTPAGKTFAVPSLKSLVTAVADEWDAQGENILPSTMPMTQLAATALDRVGPERQAILDQLQSYAETDLLCYRAMSPAGLRKRQEQRWQPLLDWAEKEFGAKFLVTDGILAVEQLEETLSAIRQAFEDLDVWHLTALQSAAAAAGSTVLGLALVKHRLDGEQVYEAAHVDELWQLEQWGDDAEAAARRANIRADILAAHRFLGLIGNVE